MTKEVEKSMMSIMFSCTKNVILIIAAVYLLYLAGSFIDTNWASVVSIVTTVIMHINAFFEPIIAFLFEHLGTIFIGWLICSLWVFCVVFKLEMNSMNTPTIIYVFAGLLVPIGCVLFFMATCMLDSIASFFCGVLTFIMFLLSIGVVCAVFCDDGVITSDESPAQLELFDKT